MSSRERQVAPLRDDAPRHCGLKRIARDTVHQAVNMRAHECRFHPVRDYLDDLQWDGISRVEKSFANYFGTKSFPPYVETISRMFPLAAATGPRMYVAAIPI